MSMQKINANLKAQRTLAIALNKLVAAQWPAGAQVTWKHRDNIQFGTVHWATANGDEISLRVENARTGKSYNIRYSLFSRGFYS